jgi:hypothetical protein
MSQIKKNTNSKRRGTNHKSISYWIGSTLSKNISKWNLTNCIKIITFVSKGNMLLYSFWKISKEINAPSLKLSPCSYHSIGNKCVKTFSLIQTKLLRSGIQGSAQSRPKLTFEKHIPELCEFYSLSILRCYFSASEYFAHIIKDLSILQTTAKKCSFLLKDFLNLSSLRSKLQNILFLLLVKFMSSNLCIGYKFLYIKILREKCWVIHFSF